VVGAWVYEISSAGAILSSYNLVANDGLPVQMFGNGNQLGMVTAGLFLINNGSGWRPALFQISGTVTAVGTAITWASGDKFTPAMAGINMYISGQVVTVSTYTDTTHITLLAALGGGAGTCTLGFSGSVNWVSGDVFTAALVGLPISINGTSYMVENVLSPYVLQLVNPNPGSTFPGYGFTPVAFNAVQPNLTYSAAAGDAVTAITGGYLNQSFYVQRPAGGTPDLGRQVNFSAVADGTSWSGLDFFTKESAPDYLNSIYVDRGQIFLCGYESSEVWQNDLNTGRPVRIIGAEAREGQAARYGTVSIQERLYFLGGSPVGSTSAYRVDGFTPTRISTHAVEQAWAKSGVAMSTAVAWSYLEDGHYFWVICFSNGSSWVYDATEKFWHERASWTGSAFASYLPWYHTFIPEWGTNGQHIVGDHTSGKIWIMDSAYFDEDGADVKRVRALPYLYAGGGKRVYCDRLSLDMATGLIPSGSEPTITLEWSSDNGKAWSAPEDAGFGLHDETAKRVFWIAQGSAETSMIPRLAITGQAAVTMIDCEAEVSYGDS
jgi:hypothetical protein